MQFVHAINRLDIAFSLTVGLRFRFRLDPAELLVLLDLVIYKFVVLASNLVALFSLIHSV